MKDLMFILACFVFAAYIVVLVFEVGIDRTENGDYILHYTIDGKREWVYLF